jgi:hypothetical protein
LAACNKSHPSDGSCTSNADCTLPGTKCDTTQRQCICTTSEACKSGQFCNHAGVCQDQAGCGNNADCIKPNTFCDIASGQCLDGPATMLMSKCGLVTHCPYGTTCQMGQCVAGCFDDGDCMLGQVCFQGQCSTGDNCGTMNAPGCICSASDFCPFGDSCDFSTTPGTCKQDNRGPYCRGCTVRDTQNPNPCDSPRNFCLVNNLETGGHPFICGVDCSLGQPCPNGYFCDGVLILTQDPCQSDAECQCDRTQVHLATATCTVSITCDPRLPNGQPDRNASFCEYPGWASCNSGVQGGKGECFVPKGQTVGSCTCGVDADCPSGQQCVGGLCCGGTVHKDRQCQVGEGDVSGFCTCARDSQCPNDACDASQGACLISGLPCTPGANDCPPIPCVIGSTTGGHLGGACLIGSNCAPKKGYNCTILIGGG